MAGDRYDRFNRESILMRRTVLPGALGLTLVSSMGLTGVSSATPPTAAGAQLPALAQAPALAKPWDFDGDGKADQVFASPGRRVSGEAKAGAVFARYASGGPQTITQRSKGIPGAVESGDKFGSALASGDFDGNGFADLAVGSPGEAVKGFDGAGTVTIIYGSPTGLRTRSATLIHQGLARVPGRLQAGDNMGAALAAGDFNANGFDDLVVGLPGEDIIENKTRRVNSGTTLIFRGRATGLTTRKSSARSQLLEKVPGRPERGDKWGTSVAVGRVNRDRFADLVVGVPGEDGKSDNEGLVAVMYGNGQGLGLVAQVIGGTETRSAGMLGAAVAVGDVDNDSDVGDEDVIAGAPKRTVDGRRAAGGIVVLEAGGDGVHASQRRNFSLNTKGVPGKARRGDKFGAAVAVGTMRGDGFADLLVGVPKMDVKAKNSGAVVTLRGSGVGVTGRGSIAFSQAATGMQGAPERGDQFGLAVAFSGSTLQVGSPGEDIGNAKNAGFVHRIPTRSNEPRTRASVGMDEADVSGGTLGEGATFGRALA